MRCWPNFTICQPHHSAQPTCNEGMAANWLVSAPRPRGALPAVLHQPQCEYRAMVSAKPASIRGGATGSRLKPTSPMIVVATRTVRAGEYDVGYRRQSQIRTA